MADASTTELLHELFHQLRRRRFPLGPGDLAAVRRALGAGFGWASLDDFRNLIVALWAKSARESAIVQALFTRLPWPRDWTAERVERRALVPNGAVPEAIVPPAATTSDSNRGTDAPTGTERPPETRRVGTMPALHLGNLDVADARLVFVEQFPLTHREIAQAFRRLRRPLRFGPKIELDVPATIARRSHAGVAVPPVIVAARRNTSHLLLFLDVEGSMAPYRPFVRAFCDAVLEAGWLQRTQLFYFHDVPVGDSDYAVLDDLDRSQFFPLLDPVLTGIEPMARAELYADEAFADAVALQDILVGLDPGTVALIVSDAGAVRGRSDLFRLADSVAFVKALRAHIRSVAWLNPVPPPLWTNTNASRLARHVPMYPLDRIGIQQAVNALRGQPVQLERPL